MIRNKQFKARVILFSNENPFIGIAYLFTSVLSFILHAKKLSKAIPNFIIIFCISYLIIVALFHFDFNRKNDSKQTTYVPNISFLYLVVNTTLCQDIRLICQCFWRAKNVGLIKQLVCSKPEIFLLWLVKHFHIFITKYCLKAWKSFIEQYT